MKALKPSGIRLLSAFPVLFPLLLADFQCSSDGGKDAAMSLQGSSLCMSTFMESSLVLNKHEERISSQATERLFWCVCGCRLFLWRSGGHAPWQVWTSRRMWTMSACGWLRSIIRWEANSAGGGSQFGKLAFKNYRFQTNNSSHVFISSSTSSTGTLVSKLFQHTVAE